MYLAQVWIQRDTKLAELNESGSPLACAAQSRPISPEPAALESCWLQAAPRRRYTNLNVAATTCDVAATSAPPVPRRHRQSRALGTAAAGRAATAAVTLAAAALAAAVFSGDSLALAAAAAARAGAGAALAHLAALTLALAANGVSCAFGPFRGV